MSSDVVLTKNLGQRPEFHPTYLGPVFRRDENGQFVLPEHTIGLGCIRWAGKWLRGADGDAGWKFTPEQMRLLMHWYATTSCGRLHSVVAGADAMASSRASVRRARGVVPVTGIRSSFVACSVKMPWR